MKEYTIGKNDTGMRLDRFVSKTVTLLPPSLLQKYIRIKRIKVSGKGSCRDYKLKLGDVVSMYVNDEFFETPNEETAYLKITDPGLAIIYEDENLLLVNKRAGVLCHSAGGFSHDTLIARIQAYMYSSGQWRPCEENSFAPALCNRIDRNTSGIVIAAKNGESLRLINEKIRCREIDKYYLAVLCGRLPNASGVLDGYIFKDAVKNRVYVSKSVKPGSKHAITEYRTLAVRGDLTLVECRLITGRTHQIRAQFAAAGNPLLGDGKYGSERVNKQYSERKQALCSYRLAFRFKTDAGALSYLDGTGYKVDQIEFLDKYFKGIDI